MADRPITLLIVDDLSVVRRGLRMRFELEPDLEVLGEAADGREGLELVEALDPDVVVLDLEMPEMDGLSVAESMERAAQRTQVVMLSLHDEKAVRTRVKDAGVREFVTKHEGAEPLLAAIRRAGQAA